MVEFTVELTGPVQKADGPYSVLGTGVFKALALGALGMFESALDFLHDKKHLIYM
ncbi:hypothetical protein YC2023_078485 [Brassica napus]